MTSIEKPKLSIVIASCVGRPFIERCLDSLAPQLFEKNVECIVVDRAGGSVEKFIVEKYDWVQLEKQPSDTSVPDLRHFGITKAKADYIAIIEEHCVAREDWVSVILERIKEPVTAIGGVVEDDNYKGLTDWAVYFTEYNSYMPPVEPGETTDICAANCVYQRELLLKNLPEKGSGYWEAGLNKKLIDSGELLLTDPNLVVRHTGPFGLGYYLRQRFLFSRAFAGTRREHTSWLFRLAYLFLAPLLIPLLWARTAARVYEKKRHFSRFVMVTPYMVPITATYVFGEWYGFLTGRGDSLSKIE